MSANDERSFIARVRCCTPLESKDNSLSAPVIAVLNLKGGVGKTTVTLCVGRGFFDTKKRAVLLADLDPQFNLTQALQSGDQYQVYLERNKTILAAFEPAPSKDLFRIRTSSAPPPSASELEKTLWHYNDNPKKRLALIMGNFDLMKYSLLADDVLLQAAKTRFLSFISQCRNEFDVVLLDCNPSSSFLTRCALEASTDVLVPVRPDKYSNLGIDLLQRFIDRLGLPRPPKLHVLLNATSRGSLSDAEQQLKTSSFASSTLSNELYKSDLLTAKPGIHVFPVDKKVAYSATLRYNIRDVCLELSQRVGI